MSYEIHVTQRQNGEWYVRTVGETGSTVFQPVPTNPRFAPARLRVRGFSMREIQGDGFYSFGFARQGSGDQGGQSEADPTIATPGDEEQEAPTSEFGF